MALPLAVMSYAALAELMEVTLLALMGLTAAEIIGKTKQGKVWKEFPDEYKDKTLEEIEKDAKANKPNAKKAKKLLTDSRFNK